ncbi:MAG: hypothetical protein HN969_01530, partial [Verrucomicrobia bacterium]|nr:hypothetical protein [Verrucomicrobiota bacterium]
MRIDMINSILTETITKRLAMRWLAACATALGILCAPSEPLGQVTITAKDMFSKEGQYYKVHSNFIGHFSEAAREEVD